MSIKKCKYLSFHEFSAVTAFIKCKLDTCVNMSTCVYVYAHIFKSDDVITKVMTFNSILQKLVFARFRQN